MYVCVCWRSICCCWCEEEDKSCNSMTFTAIKFRRQSLLCLLRCTLGRGSRSVSNPARNCSGSGPSSSNPLRSGRSRGGFRSSSRCHTLQVEGREEFQGIKILKKSEENSRNSKSFEEILSSSAMKFD